MARRRGGKILKETEEETTSAPTRILSGAVSPLPVLLWILLSKQFYLLSTSMGLRQRFWKDQRIF